MKTIIELMEDVKTLQNNAANLYTELAKWQSENEKKEEVATIDNLMQMAKNNPIQEHPLNGIREEATIEAYLVLLFSVANRNVSADKKMHPMLYPCRVAVSLSKTSDVKRYFKKSFILDELKIHMYIQSIKKQMLGAWFIVDSLIMTAKYDEKNLSKLDYIADLASLLSISRDEMASILFIASKSSPYEVVLDLRKKEHGLSNLTVEQAKQNLKKGDHIVARLSHGIYDGEKFVYTYQGNHVFQLSLQGFASGGKISSVNEPTMYLQNDIIQRAHSRLGSQADYTEYVDSEGFATWCRCGHQFTTFTKLYHI